MAGSWRRDALAAGGAGGGIAAIIAGLRAAQDHPNPTIAALLLLLVVLITSTAARRRIAIGVSVAAMLAFNFFLLPPYYTFAVSDPQNWVGLFVFVTVALVASQLSAIARERTSEAAARKLRADLTSALLASFSHDLRTPLTSVRVAVENLQDVLMPAEERQAQARLALQELDRLTRLLQGILDMARIDAAAVNPDRQWVSPADVVDAAIAYVESSLRDHPLEVDADDGHEIQADPRLTSMALAHVLENAARYSPGGASIVVHASTDADGAQFVVRDHGPGLDPSDLNHLFEPFYRGSRTRHTDGTGLGLAITRGLLAAEEGRVWCENVAAGGAQFTLIIPSTVRVSGTTAHALAHLAR